MESSHGMTVAVPLHEANFQAALDQGGGMEHG